jgi:AAA domain
LFETEFILFFIEPSKFHYSCSYSSYREYQLPAILPHLRRRHPFPGGGRVGFLKPVGQQSVTVIDVDGRSVMVDKDAALVKQHFQLDHISYQHTSPVLIPPGYTRDYLDGIISSTEQTARIQQAFRVIENSCDIVLCEGTGHVAVGSIGKQFCCMALLFWFPFHTVAKIFQHKLTLYM